MVREPEHLVAHHLVGEPDTPRGRGRAAARGTRRPRPRPALAASRSSSDMAAASQVTSPSAASGPIPDTSPPAPRLLVSVPSSCALERHRPAVGHEHDRPVGGSGRHGRTHRTEPLGARTGRSPRRRSASDGGVRVVAAPDKLRGTASATAVAKAIGDAAFELGLGLRRGPDGRRRRGHARRARRRQPHRPPSPVRSARRSSAAWRLDGRTAVIEMAAASGLELVGGAEANDPVAALDGRAPVSSIVAALDAGARRVIVGLGGSATTDGGLGALRALHPLGRLKGIELVVACDSRVPFLDAADGVRAAEGRDARAGGAAAASPRAPGPGVPRRARRRRARARGRRRRRRARRAGWRRPAASW